MYHYVGVCKPTGAMASERRKRRVPVDVMEELEG